ncbi:hypothetical protein FPQ18DRAFT_290038 [Pyronema domesticum]|uniref:RecQ-mediated genome instability protein 1 n=1 Tax=Pyronema omphalodes (strain CBS 100304) TaxID=1076935 RepID=U4L4C2_PYROM|nr:hypothetical protein FPQ18DRAFT_290038 [Pyronema domesticum]CCX11754.1 Similar to hypothetical protein NFIA_068320 [Neosartorya fischeri NRRL 181]; acc. no. XP_001263560 [Pyronema omphalodes CBS 100304]
MSYPTPSLASLQSTLLHSFHLPVRPTFLRSLLTALQNTSRPPHGAALLQTLKFRILSSDITQSLEPRSNLCLPSISSETKSITLGFDGIIVQALDIKDLTQSLGDTMEAIEMGERGEKMKGREVVRITAEEAEAEQGTQAGSGVGSAATADRKNGVHKLLLQDSAGTRVWGLEVKTVEKLGGINIGGKLLLRGCTVARGVVLLTPETVTVLGGREEAMSKSWKEERKEVLRGEIEALRGGR